MYIYTVLASCPLSQPPIEPAAIHYHQQRRQPIAATSLPCTMSPFPQPADASALALHADVWPAHALAQSATPVQCTGHAALDAELPGAGWPVGALIEVLQTEGLHAEWRLLLPALAACGDGPLALVGPPYMPFAPALAAQGVLPQRLLCIQAQSIAQRLWAAEQLLRCAAVDVVLLWLPAQRSAAASGTALRRLQMAAAQHHKLFFLVRPAALTTQASPAAVRICLAPPLDADAAASEAPEGMASAPADALQLQLLKRRGPPLAHPLRLSACFASMALLLAAHKRHALACATA
jgi:protein ImuA